MIQEEEFKIIVRKYTAHLFRYVMKNVKDEKASEDIVQTTFIKLWENRKNVQSPSVKSWLFSTAYHSLINYVKRSSRSVDISTAEFDEPVQHMNENFSLKEILDKALDTLPPVQKSILLLRDMEGYNYDEIGKILDLTPSQVKVYLFRGRQTVKNKLKNINALI